MGRSSEKRTPDCFLSSLYTWFTDRKQYRARIALGHPGAAIWYAKWSQIVYPVTVHRLHRGVLCVQPATRFHGARVSVISFHPQQNLGLLRAGRRGTPTFSAVCVTKFRPNRTTNVGNTDRMLFTPLTDVRVTQQVYDIRACSTPVKKTRHTKFHDNPTNGLILDIKSRTDRQPKVVFTNGVFF
jgi:hypothetical protein